MRTLGEEAAVQGFDLKVTHRDEKSGAVVETNPYVLRVCGTTGSSEKTRYWERPAGSGNLFDKKGQPCGRWDSTKPEGQRYIKGAAHVEWTPPETKDQKIIRSLSEKDLRIAELEKELAAINAEKAAKAPAPAQKKVQGS